MSPNLRSQIQLSDYQRIEKAIQYLEDNFQQQPTLEALAEHLHLSPFHVQRLFKRWAGISPKRFLQYLTLEYAQKLLAESHSLLDTTYAAGLSSPSRLHDLFVTIDAVTPGEYKARGAGVSIAYGFHPSPFGDCLLAVTERGICGLHFVTQAGRPAALKALQQQWPEADFSQEPQVTAPFVDAIFPPHPNGDRRKLTLFLKGSNFQVKVWEALLRIPPAAVCSYGDIARAIGNPKAGRAVGAAVGRNPIAYLIPCHRVIRQSGVLDNYRWGNARKKAMLGWEAAQAADQMAN